MKGKNKRTAGQIKADRAFIADARVRGLSLRDIVDELNEARKGFYRLSQTQVYEDLRHVEGEWKEASIESIDKIKAQELAGLRKQEAELWIEWGRSKEDQTKKEQVNEGAGTKSKPVRKKVVFTSSIGDVRIMTALLQVREQRAKLLGLHAPAKIEHSGVDGAPLTIAPPAIQVILPEGSYDPFRQGPGTEVSAATVADADA